MKPPELRRQILNQLRARGDAVKPLELLGASVSSSMSSLRRRQEGEVQEGSGGQAP